MCHCPLLSQEAVFEPAPSPRERENAQKTDTTDTSLDPDVPPRWLKQLLPTILWPFKFPFLPWFLPPWLKTSQFVFGSKGSHKCWKILVISDIFLVNLLWVVSTVILKSVAEGLSHKYLTIGWAGDDSPHSKNITICARESFWRLCNVRLVDLVNWQQGKLSEVRILYLGNAFRAKGSSSASVMFQYIAILAMMVTRNGKVCGQHKWQLGN